MDQKLKDIISLRYNSILINKYINEIFNYFISLFIFNNFMNIFKIKKVKYSIKTYFNLSLDSSMENKSEFNILIVL